MYIIELPWIENSANTDMRNTDQLFRPYKVSSAVHTVISTTGDRTNNTTECRSRNSTPGPPIHMVHGCWFDFDLQLWRSRYALLMRPNFLVRLIQWKKYNINSSMQIYIYIYEVHTISFQTFFVWAFKIVVDSLEFSMLLLYNLWDEWPIFMISGSNQQLQKQLEYTLPNYLIVTAGEFQKGNLTL